MISINFRCELDHIMGIIQLDTQAKKSQLSEGKWKPLNKTQTEIKKISYINPSLSTIKSSTDKNAYKMKGQHIDNNFSF